MTRDEIDFAFSLGLPFFVGRLRAISFDEVGFSDSITGRSLKRPVITLFVEPVGHPASITRITVAPGRWPGPAPVAKGRWYAFFVATVTEKRGGVHATLADRDPFEVHPPARASAAPAGAAEAAL